MCSFAFICTCLWFVLPDLVQIVQVSHPTSKTRDQLKLTGPSIQRLMGSIGQAMSTPDSSLKMAIAIHEPRRRLSSPGFAMPRPLNYCSCGSLSKHHLLRPTYPNPTPNSLFLSLWPPKCLTSTDQTRKPPPQNPEISRTPCRLFSKPSEKSLCLLSLMVIESGPRNRH